MKHTATLCWACAYPAEKDHAHCSICSSSFWKQQRLARPNNTGKSWYLPTLSASKLLEVAEEHESNWMQSIKEHQTLSARRPCETCSEGGDGDSKKETYTTITLQKDDAQRPRPAITLTSTSATSPPTMDIFTWVTFNCKPWDHAVYVTLRQDDGKQHKRSRKCSRCKVDVRVNREWAAIMIDRETAGKVEKERVDDRGGSVQKKTTV